MLDEERNLLDEALRMLEEPPSTALLPTLAHLQALMEAHECQKIVIMRDLNLEIKKIGEMP